MGGGGRTDRPGRLNYKASSHRLRSSMRNDRQGRRVEIEGKKATGQDDDPDCVGKEHRQDIIHLQGIILLLAGSQKARAPARARARCIFFFSFSFYLPSTLPPSLFSSWKNRGAESPLPLFGGQRARERSSEEPPREQRSCDRGSSAENSTEAGWGTARFPRRSFEC